MTKSSKIDDQTLQQMILVLQETNHSLITLKDVPMMTARLEERFAHMQKMFTDNCDDNTKRNESIIKTLSALSKRVDDVEARQDKLSGIYAALIPITGILTAGVTYLVTKALDKLALIAVILAFMGGPK